MRTSNLIQSYISIHPANQQYKSDKAVKEFDVHKELSNRTFIKPLPSNGKLVRNGLFDSPAEFRKDMIYDWNAFKHAVKGEANDHELGRLNDVGMKLGGLAIATYLFTRKQTPMTKIFEFIGLGTFFAAMDLWPKLFIQLPAQLIHGVNVRQQYEDSFGRKKMFYQDHQFIPWDLYSDDEINRIGDRLGVDKDMPNRRDFIQERMRKLALQNNTLWMLTAGFATPLMSALMCNLLEKPVASFLDNRTSKQADRLLTDFDSQIRKFDFTASTKSLEELLAAQAGKPVTEEFVESVIANFSEGLDNMTAEGLKLDFENILPVGKKFNLSAKNVEGIKSAIKEVFAGANLTDEQFAKIIPSEDVLRSRLADSNLLGGDFTDFSEHTKVVQDVLEEQVKRFVQENPDNPVSEQLSFFMKRLIHARKHGADSPLLKAFKSTGATILDDNLIATLRAVSTELNAFKAKSAVLDKYAFIKAAQAPETSLANGWNQVQSVLFKALKFTPEEISQARLDGELASKVLRNKLEMITADKQAYTTFISEYKDAMQLLQKRIESMAMTESPTSNSYKNLVDAAYDSVTNVLNKHGFYSTVDNLIGFGVDHATSSKGIAYDFITDRVKGVKSSFYRFLNMADMYYRISNPDQALRTLLKDFPREAKEELLELAKITLLEGHNSDFAVKFWQLRNPNPNLEDYSDVVVEGGKVINKYFGTHEAGQVVELANDNAFYKTVMKMMFGEGVHSDTLSALGNSVFKPDFLDYRTRVLNIFGGDQYFVKPSFVLGSDTKASSWTKFLTMGSSPNEMFHKWANQSFNSGKWFSMFGKLGVGLVAVTLIAQPFFGKIKAIDPNKEGNA